ncbi:phosphatidate cytidylyltransferase [Planktothrix paucivesiculata]|uniref:Phosphatidate cytidylyltransferase n=1 Tax=Planktothrix paucivesiculata PCC 9631 TaxID=671071 RepID=A0A7Z9E420_9CYAN|nr:phosphatidate cytidylyltransferase [Planktothrix paucivesiculata]VXD25276.1 putative Phosphatidate cytidylyltransferase [Planktothrix paucivesiculata PCC 9631]
MEIFNPLIVPTLTLLGGEIAIALSFFTLFAIIYRRDAAKIKHHALKLAILIAIGLILIGAAGLGKYGLLPVTLLLAYFGWQELLNTVQIKYGAIPLPMLLQLLGTVGIVGGLWENPLAIFFGVIVATWVGIAIPIFILDNPPPMYGMLTTAFGMVLITLPLACLLTLVDSAYQEFNLLILLVLTHDGFSQGVGQILGKNPLIPKISPNKTWEGTIGGLLSCLLLGGFAHFILPEWQLWQVLLLSGAVAFLALTGDLIASCLKREAGIKDFSQILAVTGGILDKFDSLIFTIPIFYIIVNFQHHLNFLMN